MLHSHALLKVMECCVECVIRPFVGSMTPSPPWILTCMQIKLEVKIFSKQESNNLWLTKPVENKIVKFPLSIFSIFLSTTLECLKFSTGQVLMFYQPVPYKIKAKIVEESHI